MQVDTRVDVFEEIFLVFLGLGTLVGVIVVAYTLYNAYKYRDEGDRDADADLPTLGELPTGGGSGKKLFVSFFLSALIVISLIVWTYGMLLYVEDGPDELNEEALEVEVVGEGFAWWFTYDNGVESTSTLRVPAGEPVRVQVTGGDVWHAFGIPDQRVKADAIPGEYDETWFQTDASDAEKEQRIECFELCGPQHTSMVGTLQIMEPDAFETWMDEQLTMTITLENENEERVTEGFTVELQHQEESDRQYTYAADEFENGSITINEIDQGGVYNVTVTPDGDQFETYEGEIEFTGQTDETIALDTGAEAEDDEGENENGGDE